MIPDELPLSWVLTMARANAAGDPYAFRVGQQRYLLLSPGGGTVEAEIDWDKELLADLTAVRRPNREQTVMQRLGEKLRRFLEPAGWSLFESRMLDTVRAGRKTVLTLRSSAAEIYALPWELITLKSTGQHLGELQGVLLSYEWPETMSTPEQTLPAGTTGRILFGWSAAAGAVPAAEHLAAIQQACSDGAYPFDSERDVVAHASLDRLAAALEAARRERKPVSVLHLLCHGRAAGPVFGLVLDGESDDGPALVDAGALRRLLSQHAAMVRMVVLAACDAGNTGELGNQLGSVAQALHRSGIAKVVASRYPLSVSGSIRLTREIYRQLCVESVPVEEALLQVRQELFRSAEHLDWASLQLYTHAADGAFQPLGCLHHSPILPAAPAPSQPTAVSPAGQPHPWRRFVLVLILVVGALVLGAALGGVKSFCGRLQAPAPKQPAPSAH